MAATVTIDFNANLARFSSSIDKATADLNKFQTNASRMASNVKGAFAALGAGIVVSGMAAFARNTIDAADALTDLSKRTNVSIKDLASFKTIAEQSGTSLDVVAKGLQRLQVSIGVAQLGNKEYAESLQRLGVTAKDPKEALFQLAEAVQKSNDPTKLAADLQKVLSRSYAEMLPLLKEGAEGLRAAAAASESFAEAMSRLAPEADRFNDNLTQMRTNLAGTTAQVLAPFVKSLNDISAAFQSANENGSNFYSFGEALGNAMKGYAITAELLVTGIRNIGDAISGVAQGIGQTLIGNFRAAGQIIQQTFDQIDARAKASLSTIQKILEGTPVPSSGGGAQGGTFNPSALAKAAGGSKSDPLASLLKSTDIGKLREFEKQVALLNERFNYGKKESELYAQAMTQLVESTFANNFKQAAEDAEFMNTVLEDGENTVREYGKAWEAAGAALTDEMRMPLENLNLELGRLQELLDRGAISWETYTRAVLAAEDKMGAGSEQIKTTKTLAEELNIVFESAFTKAIEGGAGFQDVMKGLLADVIKLIAQMLILEPLLKSIKDGLGASSAVSSGGGFNLGSLFSDIGSGIASFFNFANGGVMTAAGPLPLNKYASGGIASSPQLALFGEGSRPEAYVPLPDGRRIPVQMSGGGGGQVINNITIKTDDPSTVRASRGQLLADISNQMQRANRWR